SGRINSTTGYHLRWPKKNSTHCPGWVDHYTQHGQGYLTGLSLLPIPIVNAVLKKRGQIYFYYSNFGDCAHSETLKANNSLNHAPLPRHREFPLRHLRWSLHAQKI
ncbi:hypothetical protein ACRCQL_31810, partial [Pseudomonas aeruginosa]